MIQRRRSGIYAIRFGDRIKIGQSYDFRRRLERLQATHGPAPTEEIAFIRSENERERNRLEAVVLRDLVAFQILGDWHILSDASIRAVKLVFQDVRRRPLPDEGIRLQAPRKSLLQRAHLHNRARGALERAMQVDRRPTNPTTAQLIADLFYTLKRNPGMRITTRIARFVSRYGSLVVG